jgi:hypothetical protein
VENIILYVDDAAYARDHLQERLAAHADKVPVGAVHWILVACAPRMTHRISKWVSHSARENWRAKWFAKTLEQLQPLLEQEGSRFTALLATRPLVDMTQQLKLKHGAALVVDARRPKVGVDLEPVAPDQTPPGQSGWVVPSAMAGMGALLILANELSE